MRFSTRPAAGFPACEDKPDVVYGFVYQLRALPPIGHFSNCVTNSEPIKLQDNKGLQHL